MVILGMMVVTYVPRVLPFYILEKINLSQQARRSLTYIPYAALGAMVIPEGVSAVPGHPVVSTMALGVAALLICIRENLFVAVIGSMLFAYACLSFI